MDRSNFKVPDKEVKKQRVIKPDSLSGISVPPQTDQNDKNGALEPLTAKKVTDKQPQGDNHLEDAIISEPGTVDELLQNIASEQAEAASAIEDEAFPMPSLNDSLQTKRPSHFLGNNGDFNKRPIKKYYKLIDALERLKQVYFKHSKRIIIAGSVAALVVLIAVVTLVIVRGDKGVEADLAVQNSTQVSNNAIASADFIVFGPKQGSLFTANRSDYQIDAKTGSIAVEAKATTASDSRRIAISEQRVPGNFETDPYGLKNLLISVGDTYKLSTNLGTSYIVSSYTTGFAVRGETLIFIRTTAKLTSDEWVKVFESLQPIVITELGL